MESAIKNLRDLIEIQCSEGNWNYNSYMFGMANGMILALATITREEPQYLDAPDKWLSTDGSK